MMGLAALALACGMGAQPAAETPAGSVALRVATFNVEDVRTEDLIGGNPRVEEVVELVQRLRPTIVLLNELAYDMPGAPGFPEGSEAGRNGARLAALLAKPAAESVQGIRYKAFTAPVNTGMPSGFDLDNDGEAVTRFPIPPGARADGTPGRQTEEGRRYGGDCWGFGTFPGQYGMVLLVDERCEILADEVRTFRLMPWDYMPGAALPQMPGGSGPWYDAEEIALMRLSSKSHWDVPVRLPNGSVVHLLCSHPTPPVFDGEEKRNARRNYDEIRFWADYVEGAEYIVDDAGRAGSLPRGELFIILGDLNADPEGTPFRNPIKELLMTSRAVNAGEPPRSEIAVEGLDATDTAYFGKRADYVLPSHGISVLRSGVWRERNPGSERFPSDHFPVWIDVTVPPPPKGR